MVAVCVTILSLAKLLCNILKLLFGFVGNYSQVQVHV